MTDAELARFLAKVDGYGGDGCWLWTGGARNELGYGAFAIRRRMRPAHRVAYEHWVGAIPEGLQIDHLCRTPACVNPRHLEPVTTRENVLRGLKGRLVTVCVHGHPYTPENTGWRKRLGHPRRYCRTCHRELERRRRAARKVHTQLRLFDEGAA